jgi:murein L,D-transpeptidase YcbB/YkuD
MKRFVGFTCAVLIAIGGTSWAQSVAPERNQGRNDAPVQQQQAAPAPQPDTGPATPAPPGNATNASVNATAPQQPSRLQTVLQSRLKEFTDWKAEQAAIEEFYRGRNYQLLWSQDGAASARAQVAIAHLQSVRNEGLDPRDYPVPDFSQQVNDEQAAINDVQLTASLLTYARHARNGRISYTRVSGAILFPDHALKPADVLTQLASADDLQATLRSFEPQHPGFRALQAELVKRLASGDATLTTSNESGREVSKKKRGKRAQNAEQSKRVNAVDILIANMERWRWLPPDLGEAFVIVNVPDYSLAVFQNGAPIWQTKIVVGKPGELATPLLSETMKYLTINPTWNVPPSIIRNEYLPALGRDPGALERVGLKVGRNPDGSLRVYQPPGEENALGHIRFNFPNPFLVYQHDTPNKNLFARDKRALSHGCMRVQYPDKYAEVLLSLSQPNERITAEKIKSYFGEQEKTIKLRTPIPVHVTYQTAFIDKNGQLAVRDDIYGLDRATLEVMRGKDRLIADVPIQRPPAASSKPVMADLPRGASRQTGEQNTTGSGNNWGGWNWSYGSAQNSIASFDRAVGIR